MITQPNGQGGVLAPSTGTQGGVGGPSASAPGGSPKRMVRQRNPNTFAGMQQEGMARPSPSMVQQNPYAMAGVNEGLQQQTAQMAQPTAQSAYQSAQQSVNNAQAGRDLGMFQRSANVDALGNPMMQQVMQLLNDPTQGLNEAAASNFDRQNRTLGREFSTLREGLNENMAARGLDASTIASGKLGELGARQAEAQGDVSARIQEQLIRDRATAMNSAIQAAMGVRGQEFGIDKDEYETNRETAELGFRRGFDEKKLAQDQLQFTSRLGLDTELGRGNLAVSQGQLGLGQQRLGFDMNKDNRDFTYQQGRDNKLDTRYDERFAYDKGIDTRDFAYKQGRDTVGDSQIDRAYNYGVSRDTKNDTYRDSRDKYNDNRDTLGDQYRDRRDNKMDTRYDERFTYDKGRDAYSDGRDTKNDQYRAGRDTVADNQWNKSYDQNDRNITTQGIASMLSGMGYKNLPPGMIDSIMSALGMPSMPRTGSGGGAYNGGYSGGGGGGGSDDMYDNNGEFIFRGGR